MCGAPTICRRGNAVGEWGCSNNWHRYGGLHGNDKQAMLDGAYGDQWLGLAPCVTLLSRSSKFLFLGLPRLFLGPLRLDSLILYVNSQVLYVCFEVLHVYFGVLHDTWLQDACEARYHGGGCGVV
jgi:hypothetical protein